MNRDTQSRRASHTQQESADADRAEAAPGKTPSTDMQAEDAGTPESGNSGTGPAAESVMKQTSKTDTERGGKR